MDLKVIHSFPDSPLLSAWRDYLSRDRCPSHYVAPEYFLEPYWTSRKPFAVLALDHSRVVGVLTGLHYDGHVQCGLEARPQICIAPEQDQTAVVEALMQGLHSETQAAKLVTIYTWADLAMPSLCQHGFRSQQLVGNVVLELTKGPDALFQEFTKDRRRNIRFAEKNGVEVSEVTTPDDVFEAFAVYKAWRRASHDQTNSDAVALEQFAAAIRCHRNRLVLIARVEGRPIAINTFRYHRGGLFESASNSSLKEFLHLKPNDLLQWRGIQWACSHGMHRHSLGGSHPFLRRFGGELVPVLRYQCDRTLLHRYELRDAAVEYGRRIVKAFPPSVANVLRQVAGRKSSPAAVTNGAPPAVADAMAHISRRNSLLAISKNRNNPSSTSRAAMHSEAEDFEQGASVSDHGHRRRA
jgi:hypothetical protein